MQRKNKKMLKKYIQSVMFSGAIALWSIFVLFGVFRAFEGIKKVGYGEKLSAIEIIYGADNSLSGFKILDFEITF